MEGWMCSLAALMVLCPLGAASADILDDAMSRYMAVETYAVTLRSSDAPDGPFREIIHYAYRKPGWVRMDFVQPYSGMVLIYDPEKKAVRLWPLGPKGPDFSLPPDNFMLRSAGGERIDYSDIGTLLVRASALAKQGRVQVVGQEALNHHRAVHLRVTGQGETEVEGVHRFDLWLDAARLMPLRVEAYDQRDQPIDVVLMDDLELNVSLPQPTFLGP